MKKILFATSALVATAGMAAADVTMGGYGRFGIYYNEGLTKNETRLDQRFRLTITGVTESDSGVKFEARIRFQTDDGNKVTVDDDGGITTSKAGASNVAQRSAAGFAVTAEGFRLDVGNVSDVLDSGDVVDYYGYGIGLTYFLEASSGFVLPASGFGTSSDDSMKDPTVKLRWNYEAFTVSASYTDDTTQRNTTATLANLGTSEEYQIGLGWSGDVFNVGAMMGQNENADGSDNDYWAASIGWTGELFSVSALVADSDNQADTSYGISGKFDLGESTEIRAVFNDTGIDGADEQYGVGFRHGLGGGVTIAGGVGRNALKDTVADLGVQFNF